MPPFDLPPQKDVSVSLMNAVAEMSGYLVDADADTWLIRAPQVFVDGQPPDYIELAFGHKNYFWRVPVEVKAGYAPWLFLAKPSEEEGRRFQRRSFVRISLSTRMVAIPVNEAGEQRAKPVAIELENLSAGGCLARSKEPLGQPGDRLVVAIDLPGATITLPTPSTVVRADSGVYGIQFSGLQGTARDTVARYVTDQIAHHLQRGRDITLPEPKQRDA